MYETRSPTFSKPCNIYTTSQSQLHKGILRQYVPGLLYVSLRHTPSSTGQYPSERQWYSQDRAIQLWKNDIGNPSCSYYNLFCWPSPSISLDESRAPHGWLQPYNRIRHVVYGLRKLLGKLSVNGYSSAISGGCVVYAFVAPYRFKTLRRPPPRRLCRCRKRPWPSTWVNRAHRPRQYTW